MAVKVTYKDEVIATAQNGQTVEIDCEGHKFTENLFVESYGSGGGGVAPEVTAEEVTITPTKERQEVVPTTADYISKAIVEPIPDEYVIPVLEELTATANGEYTPSGDGFSKVTVAVPETPEWDGSYTKSVDLTGTTWEIASGWQTAAGQGRFTIDGEMTIDNTTISILEIHLGVSSSGAAANYIAVGNADGLQYFDNTNGFTLKINGGTDVTDTYIARWLGSGGKDTDWTIIRFFIEDENGDFSGYKALGGMTWAEWVASEYNTDGYIVSGTSILTANSSSIVVDSSYGTVSSSNEIISGEVYQTSAGGGN